ncbi:MAG: hypothetical protein V3R53_06345 [Gammaproteobacteria bacterium]
MSEQVGADLPVARDGEGQLSKDALRLPASGTEAELGGRRQRDYPESASDSVAPEHLSRRQAAF